MLTTWPCGRLVPLTAGAEIDVTGYHGEVGEVLRAKGTDDVQAEAVNVVITSEADVRVTGVDLPGHTGTDEVTLTAV